MQADELVMDTLSRCGVSIRVDVSIIVVWGLVVGSLTCMVYILMVHDSPSVVHGTIYVSFMQVSTKDIIAQDILTHEAVYKHAKLLRCVMG